MSVKLSAASILVQDSKHPFQAMSAPIVQTSLFEFDSMQEMQARVAGQTQAHIYSRGDNPTVQEFEQKMAQLEGAEAARAFASGMGAISAALFSVLRQGARVVCVRDVYADTYRLLEKLLHSFGVQTTYVDGSDTAAVVAALPGASVLYLESPCSWTFQTQNLPVLAQAAKLHGVVTICDNSWATPLHQQPLSLGVDLVVHSASKFICGHSDTVAGIVLGSKARIAAVNELSYSLLGAKLAPWEAWLLLRGMRTLALRLRAQWSSAEQLMQHLAQHPAVQKILHPAWQRGPGNHCLHGYSSLFSILLHEGVEVGTFCNHLQLFRRGVSWGGHESLVLPAQVAMSSPPGPNSQRDFGLSAQCVRLYIGFEDACDLWQDLQQALDAALPASARQCEQNTEARQLA